MIALPTQKISLLPDPRVVQQISGAISLISLVTLLLFFALLPIPISRFELIMMGVAGFAFFSLYFILPRIYFSETLLMVGDALYIIMITYIANYLEEYGVFILFLYFVIIIADALKYPASEYWTVVLFTIQVAFFYILLGTPFPPQVRLAILTIFSFSALSTTMFIWYFTSQIINERSLRSLIEKKSAYFKTMNEHLKAVDHMRQNIMQVASHEFRTPLTRVRYALDQLKTSQHLDLKPAQLQLLQVATTANQQLISMINDLMTASRLMVPRTQLHQQQLDLVHLIKQVLDAYHNLLVSRKQTLTVQLPTQPVHAFIDQSVISVAFKNLLDNASKYTPAGGTIAVSLKLTKQEINVSVQDTGIGISKAEIPQLFSQFYRTSQAILTKPDGFGMGLHLSQQIIHNHQGVITVTSEQGKGSTFVIHLPIKIHQDNN